MIGLSKFLVIIFIFTACTHKVVPNQWEYKSSDAFRSYTEHFLEDKNSLAQSDLNRAIKLAKQSAELNHLAKIYLGECGINRSVGLDNGCDKYHNLRDLVDSKELDVYYKMLYNKLEAVDITLLPIKYQEVMTLSYEKNDDILFDAICSMDDIVSEFIIASILKKRWNKEQIKHFIQKASFYGYKKLVIYWLNNLEKIEEENKNKDFIKRKIKILQNKQ